ncbi:hypothetical protein SUGI_0213700 [Cryptomeria japonica]|uniref:homeobox-leucine zipper protein HOX20 n=1 Tax=Cryptomeria japonica TaxID=3369 RepID=UPI002408B8A5|nr:homeobox-leucine zipper protein HOX20 [Cryptomeria japonica]GLJ13491.1 hypothetical protein SUGI_0213700 [Cryptomeria japonica]
MAEENYDMQREIHSECVFGLALRYSVNMSFNLGLRDGVGQLQHLQQLQRIMPPLFSPMDGLHKRSSLPALSAEAFYGRGLSLYDNSLYEESSSLCNENEEEGSGGHVEKKRRLSGEQVKSLEMNFRVESKLEPERKMQLAAELGLQPRQVAVWFQNRRARWKTKQLEQEYELLKKQYNAVISEKDKLLAEVARLKQELKDAGKRETEEEEQENDKDQPAVTVTSSDCCNSEDTAILIRPQNNNNIEEETQQIVGNDKAEEGTEQILSPASFCSHADSNPRQMNSQDNRDKLQSLLYPHNYCENLYYHDSPIIAEEHHWLTFCSHTKP